MEQEEVSEAINLLYEIYNPETIPDWIFDQKELPVPGWNILEKKMTYQTIEKILKWQTI